MLKLILFSIVTLFVSFSARAELDDDSCKSNGGLSGFVLKPKARYVPSDLNEIEYNLKSKLNKILESDNIQVDPNAELTLEIVFEDIKSRSFDDADKLIGELFGMLEDGLDSSDDKLNCLIIATIGLLEDLQKYTRPSRMIFDIR